MLIKILKLRIKQAGRFIWATGIAILLIMLLVSLGVLLQFIDGLVRLDWQYAGLLGIGIISGIHFYRKDLRFLSKITASATALKTILAIEYLLILLPLVFVFLATGLWESLCVILVVPFLAYIFPPRPLITFDQKTKRSISWIPLKLFELKFHIERYPWGYMLVYILSLLSPIHIVLFIFAVFIFCAMIISAFNTFEPKELLPWKTTFLKEKIKANLGFTSLALAPAFTIALLSNLEQWWLIIYLFISCLIMTIFAIVYKYARINPLFPGTISSTVQSIFLMLILLPGFVLVTLTYAIFLFYKAKKNLEYYYA